MPTEQSSELKFEIGHVLFIDIVGYSKLNIHEQSEQLETLKAIVRGAKQFNEAEAERKLLRLPTGDGSALIFRTTPEAPVLCALEIAQALKTHPEVKVRMGIHSGPVNEITDLNEQANIAGAGINLAQRVMDCGDAGHILLSKHVADDLEHYPRWQPFLHDLGECEVKHGVRIGIVSLHNDQVGNQKTPKKIKFFKRRRIQRAAAYIALILALAIVWLLRDRWARRDGRSGGRSLPIPEKSIAVLPFENLSDDRANAYFAEGIQDEILTRLSKIGALKVISRTSTQKYKSAPDNLREIGDELGVVNLLEGSVQKVANTVHVNVQLIRTSNDEHVWAESYNRKLDDVFGVEGEIASAVADQLKAKLTGSERDALASKPTQNTAAYDPYLRGLAYEGRVDNLQTNWRNSAQAFAEAVRVDPNFALAWAHLAWAEALIFVGIEHTAQHGDAAANALQKAMQLAPDLVETKIANGLYLSWVKHDYDGARTQLEEARRLYPNDANVARVLAG
ncbi:MAG TPA: adenylate/guanylate cyclase domain-containing protein, partial [Chthoniobacterales bacterium]